MRIFLPLLCVLSATPARGVFDGTCPRKDPPSDVLVVSPGSKLAVTCSGHVEVDGVKVSMPRKGSSADATSATSTNIKSITGVLKHTVESEGYTSNLTEAGENRSLGHTDTRYTAVRPTTVSRKVSESEDMDGEGDYEDEEEEGEDGSRVTRGIKSKLQWKRNGRTVGKGDTDWGEITLERKGALLSLSSVRLTDSGRYTCYHRGRERFSFRVHVADAPETPSLSCYKRSPSSKIRCEWRPQKPVAIFPSCYLLLSKGLSEPFLPFPCSYSSRLSRCWCALEHDDDELRTLHMAYLCVTSTTGNKTSSLLHFIPMDIVKPDPPSDVRARQEEGHETKMMVSWSLPKSWKSEGDFYGLIYELKYRPLESLFHHWQTQIIKNQRFDTITDAMPGVEYLIQVRTKEEYEGQWSEWSTPISASTWTAKGSNDDFPATTCPVYTDIYMEGSGTTDDYIYDAPVQVDGGVDLSRYVFWISGSFALLVISLAAYLYRHKDRFTSKLKTLTSGDSSQPPPSAPTPPEGQALVTFVRPRYKEPPQSEGEGENEDEKEEEEQQVKERIEPMHFNNTSYFFLRGE